MAFFYISLYIPFRINVNYIFYVQFNNDLISLLKTKHSRDISVSKRKRKRLIKFINYFIRILCGSLLKFYLLQPNV